MAITGMNHAVLYVRDATLSARFYREVLGFTEVASLPGAVFLQAADSVNDHDLGLFSIGERAGASAAGQAPVGLYHLAWEVDTLQVLGEVRAGLGEAGALTGAADHGGTKSVYGRDPDGLEFEVCWIVPADRLAADQALGTWPLDLDAEIERFGATTAGGR
jgi:catechol-2,3-dioxygenase